MGNRRIDGGFDDGRAATDDDQLERELRDLVVVERQRDIEERMAMIESMVAARLEALTAQVAGLRAELSR